MGNPQHLDWLLEGVEAWNARRKREAFRPDFGDTDIRAAFEAAGKLTGLGRIPLEKADLRRADLRGADLRGANLMGADLREAFLEGADVRTLYSGADTNDGGAPEYTNFTGVTYLTQAQLDSMIGDSGTILPSHRKTIKRPTSWEDAEGDHDPVETALNAPVVKASAVEIHFDKSGLDARVPPGQGISADDLHASCRQMRDALIENTRTIAATVTNKLGENTRDDLTAYHRHLLEADPANPHRLAFLAGGIAQDAADPLVSEAFDNRLKFQLADFHRQHLDFLKHCVPEAEEAIRTKAETRLSRKVSKEEATEILDRLEASIAETEAATDAMRTLLQDLRSFDDNLNALELRVYSEADREKLDKAIETETKELATFGARLYWRAREVLKFARTSAGDAAIIITVTGKSVPEIAKIVVEALTPLMHKLAELITVLPPM